MVWNGGGVRLRLRRRPDLEEELDGDAVGSHAAMRAVQFDARFEWCVCQEERVDPLGKVAHDCDMLHQTNSAGLDAFQSGDKWAQQFCVLGKARQPIRRFTCSRRL
jgi:hypothetical protein